MTDTITVVKTKDFDDFLDTLQSDFELEFNEVAMDDFIEKEAVLPFAAPLRQSMCEIVSTYRLTEVEVREDPLDVRNFPERIEAIKSFVGDDETVTSNCLLYCVACIATGPLLSRIKISWSDVQFNKRMFNFAEGWILLPPTMDAGFESVSRYNRNTGVPVVLDPVRFRNLSAVRKQSNMEQDLPSKFRSLAESAAWTDRSWFTWDLHQFALLIGVEVFDFMRADLFPYLFNSEGGCGGAPPWNNLFTAAGAIYRFKRGKATRGILGIMTDADKIHTGEMRPQDAMFAKNLNLAMSGDKRWALVRTEMERRRLDAQAIDIPFDTILTDESGPQIPRELIDKSDTVMPDDALTGIAITFLRAKGYIVTEMDLVTRMEEQKRLEAIWGKVPMREIEDQAAVRRKEYSENFLQVISDLELTGGVDNRVYTALQNVGNPMDLRSLHAMERYYRLRVEHASTFSTFLFNEKVTIFKLEDVEEYFARSRAEIRNSFCESLESFYRPDWRKRVQLPDEERNFSGIERWLHSEPLNELFQKPLYPGIGVDDARIARDVLMLARKDWHYGVTGHMFLIISSDKKLATNCQLLLNHELPRGCFARVLELSVNEYISWCLSAEINSRNTYGTAWLARQKVQNPFNPRGFVPVHGALLESLLTQAGHISQCRLRKFHVLYDFPNVNRALKRFAVDREAGLATEYTGGFLTRARANADLLLPTRPLESIYAEVDFERMFRKVHSKVTKKYLRLYVPSKGEYIQRSFS